MKNFNLLQLRPTQFVLGMQEIESKISKYNQMTRRQWESYRDEHRIPVVHGPQGQVYMIDHHHFARACWETKRFDFRLKVLKDLSHLKEQEFWNFMIQNEWTYLHDQFGMGPHRPADLPMDVRCLADDPYRSLAWAVREREGFRKVNEPFFEFKWAAFYRQNLGIPLHSKSDFKDAVKKAMALSRLKAAAHLPGYKSARSKD